MPQTPVLEKKWRRAVASIVHDVRGGEKLSHASHLYANLLAHGGETSRDSDTSKKSGKSSKAGGNKSKKAGGSAKERKKLQQVQWSGYSNTHTYGTDALVHSANSEHDALKHKNRAATETQNMYVQRTNAAFDQQSSAHRSGVQTHLDITQNAAINSVSRPYHDSSSHHEYSNSASRDHGEQLDVLRARLRRMGVSEAQINACAGGAELRALIDVASGSYDINLSPSPETVRCVSVFICLSVFICVFTCLSLWRL